MVELIDHKSWCQLLLNNPDQKNALSLESLHQLITHCRTISKTAGWRFVVLEGKGSVFCSGAHLGEMKSSLDKSKAQNLKDALILHRAFETFFALPVPVICRVQGAAFGGGLGLMGLSDWVILEDNAQLAFSEVRLGLAPAVISDFLTLKFGSSLAPWMLSAKLISPPMAIHLGLAQELVKAGESHNKLNEVINHFLQLSPQAMRETKKLLRKLLELTSKGPRKKSTTELIAALRVSPEGQEGIKSFFEKRKPRWAETLG